MSNTRVLIVEDENIVAKDIKNSLERMDYEVVGIASNGVDALELVEDFDPDVILLDIMLKGNMTGIDVSEYVKEKYKIPVIFLTAYADENTLAKAKITEPYGYIIKPFKEIDLQTSIEMAVFKHKNDSVIRDERDMFYSIVENSNTVEWIFVKNNSRLVKLNTKDVLFVEALKDYVVINTVDKKYTIHSTMKGIEGKLPADQYQRVHRSYIVRLDQIKLIESPKLVLEDSDKIIPIGASYKDILYSRLNLVQ